MTGTSRRGKRRAIKRGKPFQLVVRDVIRALDPTASVSEGDWVDGPDGRRDRDVFVEGTVEGVKRSILIECKDFNPATTGPVGISIVDELDSKQRDLRADVAIICSNSGFTDGAVRKARRLGIALIGVMREGDRRIRYKIEDELLGRRVALRSFGFDLRDERGNGVGGEDATYKGLPLENWILRRLQLFVAANPIVNGTLQVIEQLRQPIEFQTRTGRFIAIQLGIRAQLEGYWFTRRVSIDATIGIYDWLRRCIQMGAGPASVRFAHTPGGKDVILSHPERDEIEPLPTRSTRWIGIPSTITLHGFACVDQIPPLDEQLVKVDGVIDGLAMELATSTSTPDRIPI